MNLVRRYRLAAGLSQAALARLVGCPACYIAYLEQRGITPSDPANGKRISDAIGVAFEDMFPDPPSKRGRKKGEKRRPPRTEKEKKPARKKGALVCRWCGRPFDPESEVRVIQGERIIKRAGHYDCLIEDIRSEPYVCK